MKTLLLLMLACHLLCFNLRAEDRTVLWDAQSDAAGFHLFHGNGPRVYSEVIETTNNSVRVNLVAGTHYFAVTAFDTNRLESEFSAEVSCVIFSPTNFNLRITGGTNTITLLHSNDLTNWTPLATFAPGASKQFFKTKEVP